MSSLIRLEVKKQKKTKPNHTGHDSYLKHVFPGLSPFVLEKNDHETFTEL